VDALQGLALVVSTLAAALAAFSYLRGVPARVERDSANALRTAESVALQFDTFKAEATSILGAVQEERERTTRTAARASATASRARVEPSPAPSRDEMLAEYRQRSGLV